MSAPAKQILRLKVVLSPFGTAVIDSTTGLAPVIWKNTPVTVEIGIFNTASVPADLTGFTSVDLEIRPKADRDSGVYVSEQDVAPGTTFTLEQWNAGTHEHATIELAAEDTAFDLGVEDQVKFWLYVGMVDGSADNVGGGGCELTVLEPGWGAPATTAGLLSYALATPYGDGAVAEGDWSEVVAITGMTATGHVDVQKTSEGPAIDRVEYDTDQIEVFLVAPAAPGDVTFKYITHRKS